MITNVLARDKTHEHRNIYRLASSCVVVELPCDAGAVLREAREGTPPVRGLAPGAPK